MSLDNTMEPHIHHNKYRLLPLHVIELDQGILLKRGCTELKILGKGLEKVLEFLTTATARDGATWEDLLSPFSATSRSSVEQLLQRLLTHRLLLPMDAVAVPLGTEETVADVLYWHFETTASQVSDTVNEKPLVIIGVNTISHELVRVLLASGLTNMQVLDHPLLRNLQFFDADGHVDPARWPAAFPAPANSSDWQARVDPKTLACVVATSDFGGQALFQDWNAWCVQQACWFLPVALVNLVGTIGPLVIPKETACYACFLARQNANLQDATSRALTENAGVHAQEVIGFLPPMANALANFAAMEVLKLLSRVLPNRHIGQIIEVNLLGTRLTTRKVVKLPHCPVCSSHTVRPSTSLNREFFLNAVESTQA